MKRILVAAAVIRREGKILIAQRPADKHQGGLWEFPGGKAELGEPVQQALVREIEEELGITPQQFRPLIRVTHDYPDKAVCLDVWEISAFSGEPYGREGQPVRWVSGDELASYSFPAANRPIVTAARLPARYFITPPDFSSVAAGIEWLDGRLAKAAKLILLRAPGLPRSDYLALADAFLARCRAGGAALMLHGEPELLQQVPAQGLHLPYAGLAALQHRPLSADCWLAASIHDQAELEKAQTLGVDFVTASPVLPTLSHPGASVMGWGGLTALTEAATVPVYALGGMQENDLERAWQAGAQGIAGIRGL